MTRLTKMTYNYCMRPTEENPRDQFIGLKVTAAELALIDVLAEINAVSRSDLIRLVIADHAKKLGLRLPKRLKYDST